MLLEYGLLVPSVDWEAGQEELTSPLEVQDWTRVLAAISAHRDHVLADAAEVEAGWRRVVADSYHHSWLKSPEIARITGTPARTISAMIKVPRLTSVALDAAGIRRKAGR